MSTSADNPGIIVGVANGEAGNVFLKKADSASFVSLRSETASIGHAEGSSGQVRLQGARWYNNDELFVGKDGTGRLTVRPDSEIRSGGAEGLLWLGYSSTGSGTLNIEGGEAGGTTPAWRSLAVGRFGDGTLNLRFGGQARADFVYLGFGGDATGSATVEDEGSKLTAQRLYIGGNSSIAGGQGTMTIGAGGTVEVNAFGSFSEDDGTVRIWEPGHLTLDGGSLIAKQVVKLGTFEWRSGTLSSRFFMVTPPTKFLYPPPLVGDELILTDQMQLILTFGGEGNIAVFNGGRLSLEGGLLQTFELDVDDGTFDFTSGLLNIIGMPLLINVGGPLGSDRTISGDSEMIVGFAGFLLPDTRLSPIRGNEVRIGDEGFGTLRILDGADALVGDTYVGFGNESEGLLEVGGAGTRWVSEHRDNGTTTVIGRAGTGVVTISGGAVVEDSDDMPNVLVLGDLLGSEGSLTLTGAGSRWDPTEMTIGHFGDATFAVQTGAALSTKQLVAAVEPKSNVTLQVNGLDSMLNISQAADPVPLGKRGVVSFDLTGGAKFKTSSVILAEGSSSMVSATVDGAGTEWTNTTRLDVGRTGDADLTISGGGLVSSGFSYIAVNELATATVEVIGADSQWTNVSGLSVGGSVEGPGGQGRLILRDGGVVAADPVHVWDPGVLEGNGTIQSDVTNGGLVAPGSPTGVLHIEGSYTAEAGGTLEIEIGVIPGQGYDQLLITGTATIDGTLRVLLLGDFTPVPGDGFTIIDAAALSGAFDDLQLPALSPDLFWHTVTDSDAAAVTLYVCERAADVDMDCAVAAADFAGFIECTGEPSSPPNPDPPLTPDDCLNAFDSDADGDVDLADFGDFQIRFSD
jgi:T5SS/PEP-CTERM-associated repeat protein